MHWGAMIAVGGGGATGALCRYWSVLLATQIAPRAWVPAGTLVVNILGCFIAGILSGIATARTQPLLSESVHLLAVTGFLGGYTTFSAFGLDTLALVESGALGRALLNVLANVALSLGGVWGGHLLGRALTST